MCGSFPSVAAATFAEGTLENAPSLDGVDIKVGKQSYFVGPAAIHQVGSAGTIRAGHGSFVETDEYDALLKGALWQNAKHHGATRGLHIEHLVVGLPLNAVFKKARYLREKCLGEHLLPGIAPGAASEPIKVFVKEVTVVGQPQGAVVNFSKGRPTGGFLPDEKLLVIDMGGGTFDWFLSLGDYTPLYKESGAVNIGTLNCTNSMISLIDPDLKSSANAMKHVEMALQNNRDTFRIGGKTYNTNDYFAPVERHIRDAIKQMKNSIGQMGDIDHILLTGGGASLVARFGMDVLGTNTAQVSIDNDPVFSNVRGFYQIAELMEA